MNVFCAARACETSPAHQHTTKKKRRRGDYNLLSAEARLLKIRDRTLAPPEVARRGNPGKLLREDFARWVSVDERLNARPGAGVAGVWESAQDDMETFAGLLDGGFGKARDFKKAASDTGIARGVKARRGFGLVGGDAGAGIEIGARADGDRQVMEGAFGFDDAVPAKRRTGFGERRNFVRHFAEIGARFQSSDGVAVADQADNEIESQCDKGKGCAKSAARTLAAGADFFGDESAEEWEKNPSKKDS